MTTPSAGIYEDLKTFLEQEAVRSEQERLRKKEVAQQRFDELSSAGGSQASDRSPPCLY